MTSSTNGFPARRDALRLVPAVSGRAGRISELELEISGHRQAESAMRIERDLARESAAALRATLGRLAGGVAHDFNNLLTVILGNCDLLLADHDADDPRRAEIAGILKAGTSGAELTRQLLALSRNEVIPPELLDLNAVVADLEAMLGALIRKDVTIALKLRPSLAAVKADRAQVEQLVLNLAVNAQDAMPEGGTLTIETAHVELDELYARTHLEVKPGPYVVLAVSDTGTGMTPQVCARVFEPFFTTKVPGKGTGLGLAIVHGIAAGGGGSVDISSEVGRGTSIAVYFPSACAEAVVPGATSRSRPLPAAETMLIGASRPPRHR